MTESEVAWIGRRAIALSLGALVISSCMQLGPSDRSIHLKQVGQALPTSVNSQGGLIGRLLNWEGEVVALLVSNTGGSLGASAEEMVFSSLNGELGTIQLQSVIDCRVPVIYKGHRTDSKGRLLMIAACRKSVAGKYTENILRFDPLESATEILGPIDLPIDDSNYLSPSPDGEAFAVTFGTLYGGLYVVDGFQAHPIDSEVDLLGQRFNLREAYEHVSSTGYCQTGNALYGDWSPDGTSITFVASSAAIGKEGPDRTQERSGLCLLDTTTWETTCPLVELWAPFRPRWSPDAELVAFSGQSVARGHQGLWVYDIRTGQLHLVAEGRFQDHLWTPDGSALVGIRLADASEVNSGEVWTYTLPQWLQSEH